MATASWTAPTADGGSALTGYTLHMLTDADEHLTLTATPDATSVDLSDTMAAATGTIWLTAENALGSSQMSVAVDYAPTTPPDDPGGGGGGGGGTATTGTTPQNADPVTASGRLVWNSADYPLGTDAPYHARWFTFTAAFDGDATFTTVATSANTGSNDTFIRLLDSTFADLDANDDDAGVVTSALTHTLVAGQTYYLGVGMLGDESNTAVTLDTTLPAAPPVDPGGGGGGSTTPTTYELKSGSLSPEAGGGNSTQRFHVSTHQQLVGAGVLVSAHPYGITSHVTIEIHAANGAALGALLATKTVTQPTTTVDSWAEVTFDTPVDLPVGDFYMVAVTDASNLDVFAGDGTAAPYATVGNVTANGSPFGAYTLTARFTSSGSSAPPVPAITEIGGIDATNASYNTYGNQAGTAFTVNTSVTVTGLRALLTRGGAASAGKLLGLASSPLGPGQPNYLASATVPAGSDLDPTWFDFTFTTPVTLTPGTTYYYVDQSTAARTTTGAQAASGVVATIGTTRYDVDFSNDYYWALAFKLLGYVNG